MSGIVLRLNVALFDTLVCLASLFCSGCVNGQCGLAMARRLVSLETHDTRIELCVKQLVVSACVCSELRKVFTKEIRFYDY